MIIRYEREVRLLLAEPGRAQQVRDLRVGQDLTWRGVGEECQALWSTDTGRGDTQSLGATLCHVAAELLSSPLEKWLWHDFRDVVLDR